ncbi:hypothetical protein BZA05DRAFT_475638 [Tricharina praecox]|uniref:uncharacterized protein n=1 Tax=Tricharina praecox TaxID=43433 RepID=UPI00221EDCEA|nr:uncharacterized protein BZA05DRAFT_475638 [Tricharina praecox]KAI5848183.1 hypothetical protein BZA05DRAFT_475638 [Tricharina praecox]
MATPLSASLSTLTTLITHCRASLAAASTSAASTSAASTSAAPPPASFDALAALHSTATLARAHITNLSVTLRPPITSGGVEKFTSELSSTIIPSLTAAACSLSAAAHGRALTLEARAATDSLLAAIGEYIAAVAGGRGDARLPNTGVVWSAADRVLKLRELGNGGVVERDVGAWAECVDDAREELKGWVEDEDLDGSESEGDEDEMEQEFWDRPTRKGRLDEATRKRAEEALRLLKLVTILFGAARKRRLLGDARLKEDVNRVDGIAEAAKNISRLVDDVGMAFYEDEDLEDVDRKRDELVKKAVELAELCVLGNQQEKDGYSAWFENCKATLQKST